MSRSLYVPVTLSSEMKPGTHFIWGWVGPRAGLDVVEKGNTFSLVEIRTSDAPVRTLFAVSAPMSERDELISGS
jgi:hypothetical protein